ncbi:MAG: OmpA family protein, partial [Calothrix sp. SM1_5_4]|nr:OmpA family protein [Calothrix sp. SM1_5_4]
MKTVRLFCIAALASGLGACSHQVRKAEVPITANPNDEIVRLESDVNRAYQEQWDVLADPEFAKARSWLSEAKKDLRDGKNQSEIIDDIAYSRAYMANARRTAESRTARMQELLDARAAAIKAGARNYPKQKSRIGELDDRFRTLAGKRFSVDKFKNLQADYLDLELSAIQATLLDQSRAKIAGARRDGAEKFTPKTYKRAMLDLSSAENVVAANRHNPNGYGQAIERAAASAQFLIEVLDASKRPTHDLREDAAIDRVLAEREAFRMKNQLSEAKSKSAEMTQTLQRQSRELESISETQSLQKILQSARKEFSSDEADVYQQGDRLLIRLKGMGFPSGRAELPSSALPMLAKVKDIASELNPSNVVVEGHTDSTGGPELNRELSQKRAEAVARYLETNGLD